MGATNAIAGAVGLIADTLPRDYGVKLSRKIRSRLSAYQEESPFRSDRGPIQVSGIKRTLGQSDDLAQFEPETLRWMDRVSKPGQVVWDVGGNVGMFASYFGRIEGLNVVTFEPFAPTFALLARNLDANGVVGKVRAVNAALSDVTGFIELDVVSWEPGFTGSTDEETKLERFGEGVGKQSCQAYRGNDFARIFGLKPDHLKIDVDGAEAAVLRGCEPLLPGLSSLLIEVEGAFAEQFEAETVPMLQSVGLVKVAVGKPASGRNHVFARPELAAELSYRV